MPAGPSGGFRSVERVPIGCEVLGDVGSAAEAVEMAASIAMPVPARSAAVVAMARARRYEGRVRLVRRAVVRRGGWMGRGVALIAVIEPPSRKG
jgi:hypothetical protein